MSTTDQVREHFKAHPGVRFANAELCKALDAESQPISVALNQLFNNNEIKREKKDGHGYDYWYGTAGAPKLMTPGAVANKLLQERAVAAAPKEPKGAKAKKNQGKVRKLKKDKKAKPAKTLRAPEIPDPAVVDGDQKVVFAIRHDGELGIDNEGKSVSLARADVQRLRNFLTTVAPLWM